MKTTNSKKHTAFQKWFLTFVEEKELDMSVPVPCADGELQIGDVCSTIMSCPDDEQAQIKQTLVMIDFKNGDVYHFLKFLALNLTMKHKTELSF